MVKRVSSVLLIAAVLFTTACASSASNKKVVESMHRNLLNVGLLHLHLTLHLMGQVVVNIDM